MLIITHTKVLSKITIDLRNHRNKPDRREMTDNKTLQFIREHRNENVRTLALKGKHHPDIDIREAVTQIEGWQLAKEKLPHWAATDGIFYPVRLSLEQCSSEATAQYKASLTNGNSLTDLTGGFGIDCSYMAKNFKQATYIERNERLCRIAKHNFSLLHLEHIKIINRESEDIISELTPQDWIFIDPARRDNSGKKVVALSDCEPDVSKLHDILLRKSKKVMIKCSPMLDITAACHELQKIVEIHIVAVNNECKELLFILSNDYTGETTTHCINIQKESSEVFSYSGSKREHTILYSEKLGKFLYEPNVAIMKAGCYKELANSFSLTKLHPNSHLYTSEQMIEDFPGRIFEIEKYCNFSKKELKTTIGETKQANLAIRNFPDSVETLRKRLKLSDGGNTYLFATTLANNKKILIRCKKADRHKL